MQIEIKIDPLYDEPKVVVLTASMTEEVHSLVEKLSEKNPSVISGIRDGMITILGLLSLHPAVGCHNGQ